MTCELLNDYRAGLESTALVFHFRGLEAAHPILLLRDALMQGRLSIAFNEKANYDGAPFSADLILTTAPRNKETSPGFAVLGGVEINTNVPQLLK